MRGNAILLSLCLLRRLLRFFLIVRAADVDVDFFCFWLASTLQ